MNHVLTVEHMALCQGYPDFVVVVVVVVVSIHRERDDKLLTAGIKPLSAGQLDFQVTHWRPSGDVNTLRT